MMNALILAADSALRTLFAEPRASRPNPAASVAELQLNDTERRLSGSLMRINHVGEVCAQALYTGQALACRNTALRAQLAEASREETDHLAWTQQRLDDLKDRPSLLNPLWYAGAFAIGFAAGKLGRRQSQSRFCGRDRAPSGSAPAKPHGFAAGCRHGVARHRVADEKR